MRGLWGSNPFSDEYPATAEFAKTGAEQPEQLGKLSNPPQTKINTDFYNITQNIFTNCIKKINNTPFQPCIFHIYMDFNALMMNSLVSKILNFKIPQMFLPNYTQLFGSEAP